MYLLIWSEFYGPFRLAAALASKRFKFSLAHKPATSLQALTPQKIKIDWKSRPGMDMWTDKRMDGQENIDGIYHRLQNAPSSAISVRVINLQ